MSKNSVTKKLIATLALLTCLCGIGTVSVHATPKAVSFNNNSKDNNVCYTAQAA